MISEFLAYRPPHILDQVVPCEKNLNLQCIPCKSGEGASSHDDPSLESPRGPSRVARDSLLGAPMGQGYGVMWYQNRAEGAEDPIMVNTCRSRWAKMG